MSVSQLAIVDHHGPFRKAVRQLLSLEPNVRIIGEASDYQGAIRLGAKQNLDLILFDLSMPGNAFNAIKKIKKTCPTTKILVLGIEDSEPYVLKAFKAGADGFYLKDCGRGELVSAIRSVLAGQKYRTAQCPKSDPPTV